MHKYLLILCIGCSIAFPGMAQNGLEILLKSQIAHDPEGNWHKTKVSIHIEEPRLSNPTRYSEVTIDNKENTFEMHRKRGVSITSYMMSDEGAASTLLDGQSISDSSAIKEYSLETSRVADYFDFYKTMIGLPHELNGRIAQITQTKEVEFRHERCFALDISLRKPMFADQWRIYIGKNDFLVKGIDMISDAENNAGERLVFEHIIEIDGIKYPRIRHWLDLNSNDYLGSDIIVQEIGEE